MSLNFFRKTTSVISFLVIVGLVIDIQSSAQAANRKTVSKKDSISSDQMAALIDRLVNKELSNSKKEISSTVSDVNFLRRAMFDLTGQLPTAKEVTLFGIDPDPDKRAKVIDEFIGSDDFGHNWASFWWDVIYSKATEARSGMMQPSFKTWMAKQLNQNNSWDQIATEMINAKGDVLEEGATAIIFTQGGRPAEVASEISRIFLGIQIQCANCHDHLTDQWKREQFHELASFFARVNVRPIRDKQPRSFGVFDKKGRGKGKDRGKQLENLKKNSNRIVKRFDKNNDKKVTKKEIGNAPIKKQFNLLLKFGDTNSDKALTAKELKNLKLPNKFGRFSVEHHMPNLDDPSDKGTRMDPVFFLTGYKVEKGLDDGDRRAKLAELVTDKNNEWFAKAFINRIWYELIGEGFYTPIDDIGPERDAIFPEVINALSKGFIKNDYDVKWLIRTIVLTKIYQQSLEAGEDDISFAASKTGRYRSDQLYDAITQVLGVEQVQVPNKNGKPGLRANRNSPRVKFKTLFGYDPSIQQDEIKGTVPQALYMMNSPTVNRLLSGTGNTRLAHKLKKFPDDEDLIKEMYLMVLSREPNAEELSTCLEYRKKSGSRKEAVEDILWSLLNSSEFLSKK